MRGATPIVPTRGLTGILTILPFLRGKCIMLSSIFDILVIGGSFFGFMLPDNFSYCAYFTGSVLILFAIINYYLTKKEIEKIIL